LPALGGLFGGFFFQVAELVVVVFPFGAFEELAGGAIFFIVLLVGAVEVACGIGAFPYFLLRNGSNLALAVS